MGDYFVRNLLNGGDTMVPAPEHLYLHIPFCTNKCYYCDFNVFVWQGDGWVDQYLDALEHEMKWRVQIHPPKLLKTIYIGGGTPSILTPKQLERLFTMLNLYFPLSDPAYEMTLEVNPGTLTGEKCAVLRHYGVNRLSIGVQSFNDRLLQQIGRRHTADDAKRVVELARSYGFDNLTLDLMFGLPEQSMNDFKASLAMIEQLEVEHLSAYNLRIEEQTLFHVWQNQNRIQLPPEDLEVEMYDYLIESLERIGLNQYEISNFARPGRESQHNLAYWLNRNYYGLGAGAHGYIGQLRYENIEPLRPYMKAIESRLPIQEQHLVSEQERIEEMLFLGLRLNAGITYHRFAEEWAPRTLQEMYGQEIDQLVQLGLLEADEVGIRLTSRGRLLSNEVFTRFLRDSHD